MPRTGSAKAEFDYVVVGGGTAGCVLARRLSDDPDLSVLLIERGPSYPRARLSIPLVSKRFMGRYLDPIRTTPQRHCGNRCIDLPVAQVLGGGSSINSMIYLRGQAEAWDRWVALGAPGWGFADVLPYFRRMEDFAGDSGPWHGTGGPVGVSESRFRTGFCEAFVAACLERGLPGNPDFTGGSQAGAGYYQFTQTNGRRSGTARDHLGPAAGRRNLTIWTGAAAERLVAEGHRVVAVGGVRSGHGFTVRAAREIVLAAGALGTPRLLLLSGFGPAGQLSRLGITPHLDLPGVGEGLQDHPRSVVRFRARPPVRLSPPVLVRGLLEWVLTRGGLLTSPAVAAGAFLTASGDSGLLDCQLVASWRGSPERPDSVGIHPCLMQVESRGSVRLASADPRDPLLVDPNYLASPRDRRVMVEAIRIARELGAAAALRRFGVLGELEPGPARRSEAELSGYLESTLETAFHPAGTCAMGQGAGAVVDPELRVRGVEGLRIADASIMPALINANTNGPTIMIAEKAADLIRRRLPPPDRSPERPAASGRPRVPAP